ncbi:MAG: hypothetical protein H0U99_05455, partial [Chthoniobacterales bacterium]|nr:hypothetical protein [Chthoniobacterales bacterium]
MNRFVAPVLLAFGSLLLGLAIGRYSFPQRVTSPRAETKVLPREAGANAGPAATVAEPLTQTVPAPTKAKESTGAPSAEQIVAEIKAATLRPSSRHSFATFNKLAEAIDENNVRDVLAFVQTLPKQQEKNILMPMIVGRWAEFDHVAAVAYAQAIPKGTGRNWALTSAVGGWA